MHMDEAPGIGTASDITVAVTTITGGGTGRILYDNGGVLGEMTTTGSGTVVVLATSPTLVTPVLGVATATSLAIGGATLGSNALAVTGSTVVVSGSFGLSGNISAPAWTTAGIRYANVAATITDTTSSGVVANAYTDLWGGNTIAASAATTFTNYYTAYFKVPTAGTNVTMTNKAALGADSISIGGAAISSNALAVTGAVTFSGNAFVGTAGGSLFFTNGSRIDDSASGTFRLINVGASNISFLTAAGATATPNLQMGAPAVDTAPVAQILSVQNVLAGGTSNVAGANFTITGSQGKGTGVGGSIIFQTAPAGSTGTVVNALVNALSLAGSGVATFLPATAPPAAGAATAGILMSSTALLGLYFGSAAPTFTAAQGSLYMRTDGSTIGTRLYVNTTGSTTWTNFVSGA